MKDQRYGWDLNQTWPVGRKWCRFTNAPKNFGAALSPKFGAPKHQMLDHFFMTSTLDTAYLRNETSHQQTKMLGSVYNVSPKSWPTFRDLWPRNGWDPFRHCDPAFGGHYVAVVKVVTCLVVSDVCLVHLTCWVCYHLSTQPPRRLPSWVC